MATKPNRLQAKQVYAYVNGVPTRRVQSFDWNSDFTIDSVFELGNDGLVEDVVSLVETNVTANSNEWGCVDPEAMFFGVYQSRNIRGDQTAQAIANTTGSIYVASFGAGGDWRAYATVGKWLQVIRFNAFPTTNTAEYVKIKSIRYAAGSQCNVLGLSPTYDLTAAPATGDYVSLVNDYTITQDTVDANPAHIILPHRYSASSTVMLHSIILPRCYVTGLTYTLDTGGASEQNYTLVGEEERMLLGTRREASSAAGSFMTYPNATLTFRIPYNSLAATGSPYAVYADSNLVSDVSGSGLITKSGSCTVIVRMGSSLGIDANSQLVYYYTNKTKRGYKKLTNLDSSIGKLSKGYMVLSMQKGTGTLEQLHRCTGVSINFPLTRESIDELGESRSIAKPLEGNLRNEVTLTLNRNDLREFAKMLGSQTAFDAGTLTEILMTNLKSVNNMKILVKLYNHQTTHDATTLLKTFTFEDCNFIGTSNTTPITGAAGIELRFSTQSLSIAGSGLPPKYS